MSKAVLSRRYLPAYGVVYPLIWLALFSLPLRADAQVATQEKTSQSERDSASESEPVVPPARERYMGRRIAQTMGYGGAPWLIRETREQEERPSEVMKQLGLKPGMTVCDMGCGNGFYSLLMAKAVTPEGKVLAVDIQQEMLHLLKLRSEEQGIDNVVPVLSTIVDPKLPENQVDLLLMVDVYHEFSHPQQMLAGIRQSLKPDGLVALLEYREEDRSVPIKPLHKMSKRQILKEYRANGFELVKQYDGLPWQHLMFFRRDADWRKPAFSTKDDQ